MGFPKGSDEEVDNPTVFEEEVVDTITFLMGDKFEGEATSTIWVQFFSLAFSALVTS